MRKGQPVSRKISELAVDKCVRYGGAKKALGGVELASCFR